MKILFSSHYSFLYGSNRSLDSLIDKFIREYEEVEVLLPSKGKFYHHLKSKNVKVHCLKFFYEAMYVKWNKKYLSLPILWIYDLLAFPVLVWKINRINPDVVYSNSSIDTFTVWVAKILRKKHIVHVREFLQEDFGARFLFGKSAKRHVLLKSDKLIFVSKAVQDTVIGYKPLHGKVIYNGLPLPKTTGTDKNLTDTLRLGVVGNIDISKQQDMAIKFMANITKKYPKITLHIVGDKDCPYKTYIKKLVKQLALEDNVVFDGFINNVEDIYTNVDVLLMCSRAEAFGRVTIEAMQRRIPVIGLDSGGTSELIEHGVSGFKFHNVDEVISALDTIITHKDKVQSVIDCAQERAMSVFTESIYTENIYKFVKDI